VIIIDGDGRIVGKATGEGSNPWQITFEKCVEILHRLVNKAKNHGGLAKDLTLKSLGLSLSGGEQPEGQEKIKKGLMSYTPSISESYYVCTDTFAPIAAAFPHGGMVLISGTGSNCELVNPDDTTYRCGGWGHMLGDEGSGYWISHRAVKLVYEVNDGFRSLPHGVSISVLKDIVFEFFNLKSKFDILNYIYGEGFSKSGIARMCEKLAKVAVATKDPLCLQLFVDAGIELGKHVMALIPKVDPSLKARYNHVPVLVEGSVFKSWDLLQPGFIEATKGASDAITLYQLREELTGSFGACVLGAKKAGYELNVDYDSNTSILFSTN
jgi:N-acetylglucosamine kinase